MLDYHFLKILIRFQASDTYCSFIDSVQSAPEQLRRVGPHLTGLHELGHPHRELRHMCPVLLAGRPQSLPELELQTVGRVDDRV